MSKRKQECWYEVKFADGSTKSGPIGGVNTNNVQSRLSAFIRLLTIQHSLDAGAVITLRLAPAEADEFSNPER